MKQITVSPIKHKYIKSICEVVFTWKYYASRKVNESLSKFFLSLLWLGYNYHKTNSWLLHLLVLWRKLKMFLLSTYGRKPKQSKSHARKVVLEVFCRNRKKASWYTLKPPLNLPPCEFTLLLPFILNLLLLGQSQSLLVQPLPKVSGVSPLPTSSLP